MREVFQQPELPPGADTAGLFPKKRLVITVALAAIGLLIAILTSAFEDDQQKAAPDATMYSESAIGQKAFLAMLDNLQLGTNEIFNPFIGNLTDGVTIFLEPNPSEIAPQDFRRRFTGKTVLVVLPKWIGTPDAAKPRHIEAAAWMESKAVTEMARAVASDLELVRSSEIADYPKNDFKIQPLLTRPQLMQSKKLTPLIARGDGILLGQIKQGKTLIYILSDPDLLNNHGLIKGNNAALVVRIVDKARNKGFISFDGSVQKMRGAISLWRQLFLPPLLGLLLLVVASIAVLVWHAAQRLRPPLKLDFGLASGKLGLVENSAALFDPLEHRTFLKQRYLDSVIAEIVAVIPSIARVQGEVRQRALDQLGETRQTSDTFTSLQNLIGIDGVSASVAARRIHIWKQEILRGLI
jgi:hypothetical protein